CGVARSEWLQRSDHASAVLDWGYARCRDSLFSDLLALVSEPGQGPAANRNRRHVFGLAGDGGCPGAQAGRLMNVHEEEGQALPLALGFLIFIGLVVAAMLSLAYASELSTQRLGDQRNTVYSADGATDAAIQVGRVDPTVGAYGDARCHSTLPSSASAPFLLTTMSNGTAASVVCTWSSLPLNPDR